METKLQQPHQVPAFFLRPGITPRVAVLMMGPLIRDNGTHEPRSLLTFYNSDGAVSKEVNWSLIGQLTFCQMSR